MSTNETEKSSFGEAVLAQLAKLNLSAVFPDARNDYTPPEPQPSSAQEPALAFNDQAWARDAAITTLADAPAPMLELVKDDAPLVNSSFASTDATALNTDTDDAEITEADANQIISEIESYCNGSNVSQDALDTIRSDIRQNINASRSQIGDIRQRAYLTAQREIAIADEKNGENKIETVQQQIDHLWNKIGQLNNDINAKMMLIMNDEEKDQLNKLNDNITNAKTDEEKIAATKALHEYQKHVLENKLKNGTPEEKAIAEELLNSPEFKELTNGINELEQLLDLRKKILDAEQKGDTVLVKIYETEIKNLQIVKDKSNASLLENKYEDQYASQVTPIAQTKDTTATISAKEMLLLNEDEPSIDTTVMNKAADNKLSKNTIIVAASSHQDELGSLSSPQTPTNPSTKTLRTL